MEHGPRRDEQGAAVSSDGKVRSRRRRYRVQATDGAFKVKAKSALSLEADGQVKIKGATVALN